MRKSLVGAMALVFVLGIVGMIADNASARPGYLKGFIDKYEGVADQAKKQKCGICHPDKDKKIRNDYAKAVGKGLPMKNTKKAEDIDAALGKAEAEKNGDGKSYGEIIKGGALPN